MPNSPNVIMAAQHAAQLSDKEVLVAPTTSQQAGLVAALALAPTRSVEENAGAIAQALSRVRTGAVAPAARDDAQGRFKRGEAVGFVQDEVLVWGDAEHTLRAVLAELSQPVHDGLSPELISVLAGEAGAARARGARADGQRRGRARAASRGPGGLLVAARRRVAPPSDAAGGLIICGQMHAPAARAFSSGEPLARERLLGAPVRWPRPSRLLAPLQPAGQADGGRGQDARAGHRRGPPPAPPERQPRVPHAGGAADRRAGDGGGGRALDLGPAGPSPRDAPPGRGAGRRRRRLGAGALLQPAVARRSLPARHEAVAARQGRRARRLRGLPPRPRRRPSRRGRAGRGETADAGPATVAHYPATEGLSSTQILTLVRGARASLEDFPELLPAAVRARLRAAGQARRADGRPLRRGSGRARAGAAQAGLRGAAAHPAAVPAPSRPPPQPDRRGRPGRSAAADGAVAGGRAAVRAHRRPARRDRGDRGGPGAERRRCRGC